LDKEEEWFGEEGGGGIRGSGRRKEVDGEEEKGRAEK
jgi:hypothetical protein